MFAVEDADQRGHLSGDRARVLIAGSDHERTRPGVLPTRPVRPRVHRPPTEPGGSMVTTNVR